MGRIDRSVVEDAAQCDLTVVMVSSASEDASRSGRSRICSIVCLVSLPTSWHNVSTFT